MVIDNNLKADAYNKDVLSHTAGLSQCLRSYSPVCVFHTQGSGCSQVSSCGSAGPRCGSYCVCARRGWIPAALRSACAFSPSFGSRCVEDLWFDRQGTEAWPVKTYMSKVLLCEHCFSFWKLKPLNQHHQSSCDTTREFNTISLTQGDLLHYLFQKASISIDGHWKLSVYSDEIECNLGNLTCNVFLHH